MTPALQTGITGLVWALSLCLVVAVTTQCACRIFREAEIRVNEAYEDVMLKLTRDLQPRPPEIGGVPDGGIHEHGPEDGPVGEADR